MEVLANKSNLKNVSLEDIGIDGDCIVYINESLCSHYRYLWSKCKALWKEKEMHVFFVSNGNIKIRKEEGGRIDTIGHISELIKKFPDSKVFDGESDSGY